MTTTRSRREKGDDGRRQQLVDAAARVISAEGVAAATTRRIASEAGVPSGLVHYWFSGKDELLEEVVTSLLREVEGSAAADGPAVPGATTADVFTDSFQRAFERVVQADERGRQIAIYELTTWALRSEGHEHLARRQYEAYRATAARLGESIIPNLPADFPASAETLAALVSTLFDGVTLAWLADPEGTDTAGIFRLASELLGAAVDSAKG